MAPPADARLLTALLATRVGETCADLAAALHLDLTAFKTLNPTLCQCP